MTDATRDTHRADRAATRSALARGMVSAVEGLLATEPYADISVDRLVAEAGLSRSTFYNYFEDKNDLLRIMGADVMGELEAAIRAWWDLPPSATRDDLARILAAMADRFEEHRLLMTAVIETATVDAGVREEFDQIVAAGATSVGSYVRRGQAEGHLDPTVDAAVFGQWVTRMIERGLYQLHGPGSAYSHDKLIDALTSIIWKTLHR